jgi:hypothetical protein
MLQNFPVVTSVSTSGGTATVSGSLASSLSGSFNIDLYSSPTCDPSGNGEGANYLGSTSFVTDPNGNGVYTVGLLAAVPAGNVVTATATDATGNTSEFSACLVATGIPPSTVPTSGTFAGSGVETSWAPVAGAESYNLYRGVRADLPNLYSPPSQPVNSCLRWSGTTTATGPILTEVPPLNQIYWYLITASGAYGESGSGSGTPGPRQLNPSGPCAGATCLHDKCVVGDALEPSCGACVSDICSLDPACCTLGWSSQCVVEALSICSSLTCLESRGACNHTLCSFGPKLTPGCDTPPLSPSCVSSICTADPFCCEDHWDEICIGEVQSICGFNCS